MVVYEYEVGAMYIYTGEICMHCAACYEAICQRGSWVSDMHLPPRPVRGRYDFHNIAIFAGPHNLRLLSSKAFAYDTHVNSFSDSTYYAHEYFESSIMVLIMVILIILIHFPSEYSRKYRINMSPTLGASLFYSLFQFHAQILKLIVCWISKLDALL